MKYFLSLLLLGCAATTLQAQNYFIDQSKIAGGGGNSSGGQFSVSGTIGQPDAGISTGGNYALSGGFWSFAAAIQQPGAPLLSVVRSNNFVIVSWTASAAGFVVQENNDLSLPGNWSAVPQSPTTNSQIISVVIPATAGNKFYRLRAQ